MAFTPFSQLTTSLWRLRCGMGKKPERTTTAGVGGSEWGLRRARKSETSPEEQTSISKLLFKAMRRLKRQRNDNALDDLTYRGQTGDPLKAIMNRPKSKRYILGVKGKYGKLHTDRIDIAEVFALFYEAFLYCGDVECKAD